MEYSQCYKSSSETIHAESKVPAVKDIRFAGYMTDTMNSHHVCETMCFPFHRISKMPTKTLLALDPKIESEFKESRRTT